jgi:hypothetical protein
MEVQPLTITMVNWKAVQKMMPHSNCSSDLAKAGLTKDDPAALAYLLSSSPDLNDSWALRFVLIQFLVKVPKWDPRPTLLDQYEIDSDEDGHVIILSGTADRWRTQIFEELSSPTSEQRAKLFNLCHTHILMTGLRTMFGNAVKYSKAQQGNTYLLRKP